MKQIKQASLAPDASNLLRNSPLHKKLVEKGKLREGYTVSSSKQLDREDKINDLRDQIEGERELREKFIDRTSAEQPEELQPETSVGGGSPVPVGEIGITPETLPGAGGGMVAYSQADPEETANEQGELQGVTVSATMKKIPVWVWVVIGAIVLFIAYKLMNRKK